ncbi:hypothetical protein TNCV_3756801 [Trichonephila clavipes]|nr:hypothetical protein TNCV_3756801 [Trichonephila clavipes]
MSSCRSSRGRSIGMMEAGWSAWRIARQLGRSDCVGTSGTERCHLHKDQAQDAVNRLVVEKTSTYFERDRRWDGEGNMVARSPAESSSRPGSD